MSLVRFVVSLSLGVLDKHGIAAGVHYGYLAAMEFEWNDKKAHSNLKKHGLSFDDACFVLQGNNVVTFPDERRNYGEERFISMGILMHSLVVIVHTYSCHKVRIISMRKANEREKKIYAKRLRATRSYDG